MGRATYLALRGGEGRGGAIRLYLLTYVWHGDPCKCVGGILALGSHLPTSVQRIAGGVEFMFKIPPPPSPLCTGFPR